MFPLTRSASAIPHTLLRQRVSAIAAACALTLCLDQASAAQSATHLAGTFEIGLPAGSLEANVCLTPWIQRDTVTIVLNRALTIKRARGVQEPALRTDLEPGGTALRYTYLREAASADGNPQNICLEYAGSFPIYDAATGDFSANDASNTVAFNGRTVRMRGISRWHPTIHHWETGITEEALTFDVLVRCDDCARVFINGGAEVGGQSAVAQIGTPRELFVVAGDLDGGSHPSLAILSEATVADDTAAILARHLDGVRGFLEGYIGIDYGDLPRIVNLHSIRPPRRGQLWGFFSDPTLTLIGMSVGEIVGALERESSRPTMIGFLAHELAHRYFGWTLGSRSEQRDLFGEPFAAYLELKAIRHFFGEEEYRERLSRLERRVVGRGWSPSLSDAGAVQFADSDYRYGYAPYLLFTLENAIGEEAMKRVLRSMLLVSDAERAQANLNFVLQHALVAGAPASTLRDWQDRCLTSDLAQTCLLELPVAGSASGP